MIVSFLQMTIAMSAVYLFGCVGEILIEKSGNLNLGIPGIMGLGALGGCLGVYMYNSCFHGKQIWILLILFSVLFSCIFSALGGFIYSFFTVTLKSNQNVTGLILTTFGVGVMKFIGHKIPIEVLASYKNLFRATFIPYQKLGWFGQIFLSYGIFVFLAFIFAIILGIVLSKTKLGLFIRAVGESPATADAQGINVNKCKYLCILIGSMISGLGGLYYVCDFSGGLTFVNSQIDAFGWLSLALVIFSIWKPQIGIIGSIVFGGLTILPSFLSVNIFQIKLFAILPYLFTIIVLILSSIIGKKNVQPPSSLGINYYREDR
ncbi:MAG: ABC transporter permease [Bacilli bacterium]|nr:ABC transporter permease [Bacilli bacterium]